MLRLIRVKDPLKDDDLSKVLIDLLEEAEKEGYEPVIEEDGEIKMKAIGAIKSGVSGIMKHVQSRAEKMKSKVKAIVPVGGEKTGRKKSIVPESRQGEKHQAVELLLKREVLQKTINVSKRLEGLCCLPMCLK